MAIAEISGTETVTTTEWSLTGDAARAAQAVTDQGAVCIELDLTTVVVGDQYELAVYEKVLSGGSQLKGQTFIFTGGAIGNPRWTSPSYQLKHGWDWTLKKLTGTDRSISWSIRRAEI